MPHLTDETLNEYLDGELTAAARGEAHAHLAACGHCAGRLARMQRLYARLEGAPEVPLRVDVAAGVMQAIARQPDFVRQPRPRRAAPRAAWRWVLAAQAAGAVLLLALAWPFASAAVAAWFGPAAAPVWLAQAQAWLAQVADPARALAQVWADAQALAAQLAGAARGDWLGGLLGPAEAGLLVALAAGVWLAGSALILRRPVGTLWRRRS
jgi:hypothetical protein